MMFSSIFKIFFLFVYGLHRYDSDNRSLLIYPRRAYHFTESLYIKPKHSSARRASRWIMNVEEYSSLCRNRRLRGLKGMKELEFSLEVNACHNAPNFREVREETQQAGLFHRMLDHSSSILKQFVFLLGMGLTIRGHNM
jgi:hypothetical protein